MPKADVLLGWRPGEYAKSVHVVIGSLPIFLQYPGILLLEVRVNLHVLGNCKLENGSKLIVLAHKAQFP